MPITRARISPPSGLLIFNSLVARAPSTQALAAAISDRVRTIFHTPDSFLMISPRRWYLAAFAGLPFCRSRFLPARRRFRLLIGADGNAGLVGRESAKSHGDVPALQQRRQRIDVTADASVAAAG